MQTRQRTSTRTIVLWVIAAHVWLLALIGVCTGGLAVWREVTPPREFQRVVNQLAEYRAAHGRYPESLAEVGISDSLRGARRVSYSPDSHGQEYQLQIALDESRGDWLYTSGEGGWSRRWLGGGG